MYDQDIQALIDRTQNRNKTPLQKGANAVGRFGALLTGHSPDKDGASRLADQMALMQYKEGMKNPEDAELNRQLKRSTIGLNNAMTNAPAPPGYLKTPKGFLQDPSYVDPMEQQKLDEASTQKLAEEESLKSSAQDNLNTIQKVKEGSKYFGPLGGLPSIAAPENFLGMNSKGYGERKDWENNTNKLLSQKVIDIISEMKRVSKTGATGFGQLSEKEGAILQQASTALSRDLPEEQALHYLNEMERIHKKVLGVDGGMENNQPPQQDSSMPQVGGNFNGHRVKKVTQIG